ncbi:MAG: SIR2 family NAD-dependent protein deacylase [Planctomycetota bacterium]|jgi:NAD-dependent deacetylase
MSDATQARSWLEAATSVVCFSGAGLSAESGIATFRDADEQGLWSRFDPMQLASPEGFARDPELVIGWYNDRRRRLALAQPNPAHYALAARTDILQVTQNVDDLLHRAGAVDVVQLHGSIARDRCHDGCGFEEPIDLRDPPGVRDCPECGAPMRPAVVWFGEMLPHDAMSRAERACSACGVLLVVGTSASVYPAAWLIGLAKSAGARIVIVNTQRSEASALADVELLGPAGRILPELLSTE